MNTLLEQLRQVIKSGTEEDVRAFVAQHFSEFPEYVQQGLAVDMLEEELDAELADRKAVVKLKQEMVEVIDVIESAERSGQN